MKRLINCYFIFSKISSVVKILEEYEKSGLSPEDAWNKASVLLTAASEVCSLKIVTPALTSRSANLHMSF